MQKPTLDLNCTTHSVQMRMDPSLTPTVQACVSVTMPTKSEGEAAGNIAIVAVIDVSGSTRNSITSEGGTTRISQALKAGAINLINLLRDGDKVAIVGFDHDGYQYLGLTACNTAGQEQAIVAVENNVSPQGGTNYNAGLEVAERLLRGVSGMTRAIAFLSDGGHEEGTYPEPGPLAARLRESGIVIYTAAVSDQLDAKMEARLKDMSGGANFKACVTAQEVGGFFQASMRKAQHTAVSNARLEFNPIGLVQEVLNAEMVLRNGKLNYVVGTKTAGKVTVPLGEIGPGDRLDVFVRFKTRMPKFPDGVDSQERTFGDLVVFGAAPSNGINDPLDLVQDEMRQRFAKTTTGAVNPYVDKIAAHAEAARALDQASKTNNAAEQQDILGKAAEKVRRATQVFTDDDDLAGNLADLDALRKESQTKGAAAAGKSAGRKTQVFVDED